GPRSGDRARSAVRARWSERHETMGRGALLRGPPLQGRIGARVQDRRTDLMKNVLAVGFDLGDTLSEYAGVPLNWEREYPAALAAVADVCRLELSEGRIRCGVQLLSRYNTRRTPRPAEREYTAEPIFQELLHDWG